MILGLCGKRVSALFRGDIECDHGLSLANVRYFKSWRPVIWLQARRNLILAGQCAGKTVFAESRCRVGAG